MSPSTVSRPGRWSAVSRSRPNVLLVLTDQHSHRFLGSRSADEGGEPVRTPALDDLAASSARFDAAYCPVPLCTPSRFCLLTGKEATRAGGWNNRSVLDPDLRTLPEHLSGSGYETYLEGKMHLGGTVQFAGFDHRTYGDLTGQSAHQAEPPDAYDHPPDYGRLLTEVGETAVPESLLQERRVVEETVSSLREHRHAHPDRPWFMCASFSRPHWPRTAPRRFVDRHEGDVPDPPVGREGDAADHPLVETCADRTGVRDRSREELRRARAGYFAAVEYIDEIIGDMIARLEREGFLDETVVVYASDHGELAGEHGLWEKRTWHEASTRVPLFVGVPAHRSGEAEPATLETPVSLLDLFPTLCGLVGVDPPGDLNGHDRSAAVREGTEPDPEPVVVDCFGMVGNPDLHYRMVRDGQYKYVRFRDAPELLFDLQADPLERRNLADKEDAPAALAELRSFVDDSLSFADADERRERDERLAERYRLPTPKGDPNQYHVDGRVIDADTLLYHPHVVTDDPAAAYDDYPDDRTG